MTSTAASEQGYQCDTCRRSIRVPVNRAGLDVMNRCIITQDCAGSLHAVVTEAAKNDIPAIPPEVNGLVDWFPRKILYTHDQYIERNQWIISHNLGSRPIVQVVVSRPGVEELQELSPDQYNVTIIDLNNIKITFSRPESGTAQCIGTASANQVNPQPVTQTTVSQLILTADGVLTIAVSDFNLPINVNISFLTNTQTIIHQYSVTGADVRSPWYTAQEVYILGKKMMVISFHIIDDATPQDQNHFINGDITSGDLVTVTFDSNQQTPNYILLAASPYNFVDRITNTIVNVENLADFDSSFFYKPNSIVTTSTDIKSIYPPIIVVD